MWIPSYFHKWVNFQQKNLKKFNYILHITIILCRTKELFPPEPEIIVWCGRKNLKLYYVWDNCNVHLITIKMFYVSGFWFNLNFVCFKRGILSNYTCLGYFSCWIYIIRTDRTIETNIEYLYLFTSYVLFYGFKVLLLQLTINNNYWFYYK